jgi:F-type H+-transporting ATPase subunit b
MPQINQLLLVYQSQWFWLLLVLAVIYFGIGRGMVPKIEATVDARDRKISDDLVAADRARAAANEVEDGVRASEAAARADAQGVAAQAKAKAAKDAENRLAKADAEIAAKLSESERALADARKKALTSLESVAAEAAADIVAKVSGQTVSTAKATNAVKAVLNG